MRTLGTLLHPTMDPSPKSERRIVPRRGLDGGADDYGIKPREGSTAGWAKGERRREAGPP
jgi:hypothetical protein